MDGMRLVSLVTLITVALLMCASCGGQVSDEADESGGSPACDTSSDTDCGQCGIECEVTRGLHCGLLDGEHVCLRAM